MSTYIITYFAGAITVLAIQVAPFVVEIYMDAKWHRRYKRAWDKFSKEFNALTPEQMDAHKKTWEEQDWRYRHWSDDRARYFDMRWNNGHTEEA